MSSKKQSNPWTETEINTIREMFFAGKTLDDIKKALEKTRKPGSVTMKFNNMLRDKEKGMCEKLIKDYKQPTGPSDVEQLNKNKKLLESPPEKKKRGTGGKTDTSGLQKQIDAMKDDITKLKDQFSQMLINMATKK